LDTTAPARSCSVTILFRIINMKKQVRLNTLQKISHYLDIELPVECSQYEKTTSEVFNYTKRLLAQLDAPKIHAAVVHVGGTSGKGTVCYMLDAILRAHDQRSALIISPHVYDSRERIQLNGQLAPEKLYIKLVNSVLTAAHRMSDVGEKPSYTGIMAAISILGSTQKRVDYIVVEAGLGGPYDVTNVIGDTNSHAILTQVGPDDQTGTAKDVSEIVKSGSTVTALKQAQSVNTAFEKKAMSVGANINWVESHKDYQTDNAVLALRAAQAIAERDGWHFDSEVARIATQTIYIPGRYEKRVLHDTLVILDGAHNPQNLVALSHRLKNELHDDLTIVFALSSTKDILRSLEPLASICRRLIITEFFADQGYIHRPSHSAAIIKSAAEQLNFNHVVIEPKSDKALSQATKCSKTVLVTGSFYLLSEVDKGFS